MDNAHLSVHNTCPLDACSRDRPFKVVVISRLHHFIARRQTITVRFDREEVIATRELLKRAVQLDDAGLAAPDRRQHLNAVNTVCPVMIRQDALTKF